jgi:hypothetical protein
MMPRVVYSSDRIFITAAGPKRWRRMGSPGSWWFAFDWDAGHVAFPARESRDPSLSVRLCGVEVTVWP